MKKVFPVRPQPVSVTLNLFNMILRLTVCPLFLCCILWRFWTSKARETGQWVKLEDLRWIPRTPVKKPGVVARPCNPSTREKEANGSRASCPVRRVCLASSRLTADPAASEVDSIPDNDTSGWTLDLIQVHICACAPAHTHAAIWTRLCTHMQPYAQNLHTHTCSQMHTIMHTCSHMHKIMHTHIQKTKPSASVFSCPIIRLTSASFQCSLKIIPPLYCLLGGINYDKTSLLPPEMEENLVMFRWSRMVGSQRMPVS